MVDVDPSAAPRWQLWPVLSQVFYDTGLYHNTNSWDEKDITRDDPD